MALPINPITKHALKPQYLALECEVNPRKPSHKVFEDAVHDSYHKAKKNIERSRSAVEHGDYQPYRRSVADVKTYSQFQILDDECTHRTKPRSWYANEITTPTSSYTGKEYGRIEGEQYVAPALPKVAVGERRHLKASRPYYSAVGRADDPDYFDFDLQHSVDMYKKPQEPFRPRYGPKFWEHRLVTDLSKTQGSRPVSAYLSIRGDDDARYDGSSYLSCALRTPTFWTHRFSNLGGT